jgi:hypothetical protein
MLTKAMTWLSLVALVLAVLFNPMMPFPVSPIVIMGLESACISVSLFTLRTQLLLSVPSIADRTPGSETL